MGFKCGIIGLPNVGKSTIFNALTAQQVDASNYPFCTIEPNIGIIPLKDERLLHIQKIAGSAKLTLTSMEFVDIAGLVKGASQGEGLGNQFLNHIQAVDALAHVVRCFEDANVAHTSLSLDPVSDVEIITTELILKDLEIVEHRIDRLNKSIKSGDKEIKAELEILIFIRDQLSKNVQIKHMPLSDDALKIVQGINLLTLKPALFIANVDEGHMSANIHVQQLEAYAQQLNQPCVLFCGKAQAEIAQLDHESQLEFLKALGLDEFGLTRIVRVGYQILHLITFFTANQNEAHAWTIPQGTSVWKAAGKIHTDFEKGFIKAEVIKYPDIIREGSEAKLREKGFIAIHGKDYIVEDGDLILFRFHVG